MSRGSTVMGAIMWVFPVELVFGANHGLQNAVAVLDFAVYAEFAEAPPIRQSLLKPRPIANSAFPEKPADCNTISALSRPLVTLRHHSILFFDYTTTVERSSMSHQTIKLILLFCCATSSVMAQGLRVSSTVSDASRLDAQGREQVVANNFSLFQSGRVYDYVEAAGEVVMFDRAAKRFTVLNLDRNVYTTITFNELKRMLDARAPKTQQYIKELQAKKGSEAERITRMLTFQLHPVFETSYDAGSGALSLTSPSWKYSVSTQPWEDKEQLERYLEYTDWMAKLNFILHPSSMFPEPRLALNSELRKLDGRIPVIVQLDRRPDERMILRAEHQFVRNLTDHDRKLISGWNAAINSTATREMPFRSYQETILVSLRR